MRKLLYLVLLSIGLASFHFAKAQTPTVSGAVTAQNDNAPLQYVTVTNSTTNKRAVTNAQGIYTIEAVKGHRLVFTYVGYQPVEQTVGDGKVINVKMTATQGQMGEVVVTAYGINRNKKSLGYSTSTVQGEEVAQTQREGFIQGLAGRVPGLSVNATSGNPGASQQIVLRGIVSLDGDNSPLIVVDGLPIDNSIFNQTAMVSNGTNRNNDYSNRALDINPADIESYTILKGPEATALYGNLGASGAIVITTKKAKAGRGSVTYNNSFRWEKQTRFPDVQQVYSQGVSNGVFSGATRSFFGPRYADSLPIYDNIHNFFKTGFTQKHNVAFEGGNEGFTYRWANEFTDNEGTIPNTKYTRLSSRLTGTANISPILNVTTTFNYINVANRKANRGDRGYLIALLTFPSRYDVREYQDQLGNRKLNTADIFSETDNPFWDVYKNLNEDKTNRILANSNITLKPNRWLTVRGTFGADLSTTNGILVYHGQSYRGSGSSATPTKGRIETYEQIVTILNGSLTATADHKFGNFNNTYILGTNFTDNKYNTDAQLGEQMYDPNFYSINNTLPTTQRNKLSINRFRGMGAFAQAVLGYKTIAYLTLSGRMDAASRLMPNNPYFFYPAASFAFNFSDLESFKNLSWLTYGKLRASYAYTGKEPRSSYITRSRLVPQGSTGGGFAFDVTGGNENLGPEFSKNFETGFELRFLKSRIGIDFTYYRLHSFDQIINPRFSYGSGYIIKWMNGGEIQNKGFEIQLTGAPIRKPNFNWDVTLNFTLNRGKVLNVAEDLPEYYNSDTWLQNGVRGSVYPGSSTGAMGGWVFDRNTAGDILISTTNGLPLLKNSTDFYDIGDRTPKYLLGFVNRLNYKNLNLSFLFDLRRGGDVYNATEYTLYTQGLSLKTLDRETPRVVTGVLKDGLENSSNPTRNTIAVTPYYSSAYYSSTTNGVAPEMFVEKNINAFRLRDVTLQYYFPKKVIAGAKFIQDLSVFVTATDVFLITNYSGIDPDSNGTTPGTGGLGGYGIDIGNMGRPLGLNVGMRIKL
ncbi:MAG: SusC/RagA family TonB-linked outer membrane protein [Chitinophagaceae bacterium]|nr:MAG: SusC/RagA family TonB-linked outer membrane protein [Chitinophagaceae bacterium]